MNDLKKHGKLFAFLLILLSYIIIIALTINSKYIPKGILDIEFMYYISQIILAMFVMAGSIIAAWQYYLSSKSDIRQNQLNQIQKTMDLSNYYKDNILHNMLPIIYVYNNTGVNQIISKIDPNNMKKFNYAELNLLLSPTDIEKLKNIQSSPEFAKAIINANIIYKLDLDIKAKEIVIEDENAKQEQITFSINSIIDAFFTSLIFDLLNNIEYFAMHFCYNIIDDFALYRSFNRTYIQFMETLYFQIAYFNKVSDEKNCTNAIDLYSNWKKRYSREKNMKTLRKFALNMGKKQ